MLCEVRPGLTPVMLIDTRDQLWCRQQPLRLNYCPLAVNPLGLDRVEPGTFDGQFAGHNPYPACSFGLPMVSVDPRPHLVRTVPRGVIPDQQQGTLPFSGQALTEPGQIRRRHVRDGATRDKAQPPLRRVLAQQPIASQCFGGRIGLRDTALLPTHGRGVCPSIHLRLMEPAPPALIQVAQHPRRLLRRQADQPVALLFSRAYAGSGLVIQCLARRQGVPQRLSARRIVSSPTKCPVTPSAQHTCAASAKVQVLRG